MKSKKRMRTNSGFCLYAAETILPLTQSLDFETEGIKNSSDIEHVHRCRVATRRIRSALLIFKECLRPKDFKRISREIRHLTKMLGKARDMDVQIEFLDSFIRNLNHDSKEKNAKFFSTENTCQDSGRKIILQVKNPHLPGPECLKLRIEQERAKIQPEIVEELEIFKSIKVTENLNKILQKIKKEAESRKTDIHSPYGLKKAYTDISKRTEELFLYESYIPDEENKEKHHEMRIAAKRLRYTLEIYSDIYKGELNEIISSVKKIQELLGDIHDNDVWESYLNVFLEDERRRIKNYFGNDSFCQIILPGIEYLSEDRIKRRKELFDEFTCCWNNLLKTGEWERLKEIISKPVEAKTKNLSFTKKKDDLKKILIDADADSVHPLQVTMLSEKLFDELKPLHNLSKKYRKFIIYAAMLHDTGLLVSEADHSMHSAEFIKNCTLPGVSKKDKQKISEIARCHTKPLSSQKKDLVKKFKKKERKKILISAQILRIADGLDRTHQSLVSDVKAKIKDKTVRLIYNSPEKLFFEEEAAQKKSDLFEHIFKKKVKFDWQKAPQKKLLHS